jgi:hypothetical protein
MSSTPEGPHHECVTKPENARFIRWQKISIDQLGYALNLILAFAVASLAYCFSLLRDGGFNPPASAKCLLLLAMLSLAFSAISGLACTLNRLWDFRETARRARKHRDRLTNTELDAIGAATWILFRMLVVAFGIGAALLAATVFLSYGAKLR